jgi:hypothetical protein
MVAAIPASANKKWWRQHTHGLAATVFILDPFNAIGRCPGDSWILVFAAAKYFLKSSSSMDLQKSASTEMCVAFFKHGRNA